MKKKETRSSNPNPFELPPAGNKDELVIQGVRQNNLKNISVSIPHNRITAIVGLSGSGKSSLAFDTLFAEGRWRFIESLSTYTRLFLERMDRPDLDSIQNIRPSIAIEQKNPVRTSRSTVATATEIDDYLRLFFAKAGHVFCPECGALALAWGPQTAADHLLAKYAGDAAIVGFKMQCAGRSLEEIREGLLKKGFSRIKSDGNVIDISADEWEQPKKKPSEVSVVADRLVLKKASRQRLVEALETAFREGGGAAWAEAVEKGAEEFSSQFKCAKCAAPLTKPDQFALSFNHPTGACPECRGFGNILKYDPHLVMPDTSLTLNQGVIDPWTKPSYIWWFEELKKYAAKYAIDLDRPFSKLSARERMLVFEGTSDWDGIDGFFRYLETKKYKLHIRVFLSRYKGQFPCASCEGTRLQKGALNVRVSGKNIAGISNMSIKDALAFFSSIKLTPHEQELSKELLRQLKAKLEFLSQTGLGYITLDRPTRSLSSGEAQRVTIATQLAASLTGVLYVLDEPSVGLHPVDTDMLIRQLKRLSSAGNTVVVVEHESAIIRSADYIIELGPGAGERGGRAVWAGPTDEFLAKGTTLTANYLNGTRRIHTPRWRRNGSGKFLVLKGARGNNLKSINVSIPLKTLTCVTGVSGSGKSTLVVDTICNILAEHFKTGGPRRERPMPYGSFEGAERIREVRLIDQSPIGRSARSNPITCIGGFDEIRRIYAATPSAEALGLTPGHFSFNVKGGRCEACKGDGAQKLEMYFLPDVYVKCAVCSGKRYKPKVLDVKYRRANIHACLNMTFDDAAAHFQGNDRLQRLFSIVREVGLGYLRLGQSSSTLSGGESQRLNIAKELACEETGDMLYVFDEPTTGLHMDDVKKLLAVINRLVDAGNTALVIEHNLDCIKTADYVIDLGPGGGEKGGRVVACGQPEDIAKTKASLTGRYLKNAL